MISLSAAAQTLGIIAGTAILLFGGFFAVVGAFDKVRRARAAQGDKIDEELIAKMGRKIDFLEAESTRQAEQLTEVLKDNNRLKGENKALREILQGRDDATIELQKRLGDSIDMIASTHQLAVKTATSSATTARSVNRLVKAIEGGKIVAIPATPTQLSAAMPAAAA